MYSMFPIVFTLLAISGNFPSPEFSPYHHSNFAGMKQDTIVQPRIEMELTRIDEMQILFIPDTALSTAALADVLGKAYGEIMQCAGQNKLQPKRFMAWYHTQRPPWIVDVAVEMDRIPNQVTGRIRSRIQKGGQVVIAHMWGPYEKLSAAYEAIGDWLKRNEKIARDKPFEVYLNDPKTVSDPSEIRTDVYQFIQQH